LVKYWDKYTEMHGQQNVKICDINVQEHKLSAHTEQYSYGFKNDD